MALDFTALQTEFLARGFADMTAAADTTRVKRWINDAMHDIDEMYDWPYLQSTGSGPTPLTFTDLRKIERVVDTVNDQTLDQLARGEAADWDGDLTTTGSRPLAYYLVGGTTVTLYPTSTSAVQVLYWKFGPDLSAGGDVPLMPDRFRYAIVDYAVAYGCMDRGDFQGAQVATQAGDARVARMAESFGILEPSATFIPAVGSDC